MKIETHSENMIIIESKSGMRFSLVDSGNQVTIHVLRQNQGETRGKEFWVVANPRAGSATVSRVINATISCEELEPVG